MATSKKPISQRQLSLFVFFILAAFGFNLFCPFLEGRNSSEEYKILNDLALKAGTLKNSLLHDYMEVYAEYFAPFRKKPIRFLEIGIFEGDSVKLWESYFINAELHFIDVTDSNIKYFSNRSHYHFLDQGNSSSLVKFADNIKGQFDIIIDDGGHTMRQQITSFKALFPYIKSGGLYIIEDLHTSYWSQYGGSGDLSYSGPGTAVQFLKDLVDDLNYTGAVTGKASWDLVPPEIKQNLNYYQEYIYSIHFYDSLCFIKKR